MGCGAVSPRHRCHRSGQPKQDTQAETAPPLFVVIASDPAAIHISYRRYLVNQLRKAFGLEGVPVRVKYVERRRRKSKDQK